jgi:hypothetical protein
LRHRLELQGVESAVEGGTKMDNTTLLFVSIAILVVAACAVVWAVASARRSRVLREKFGPEYERLLQERGARRKAEAELQDRTQRVEKLSLRPLEARERSRYAEQWTALQAGFVDDPRGALTEADRLVEAVMRARGYPTADFEQRVADVSVDHPQFVENYRMAHEIASRDRQRLASTEDFRNGLLCYRALFDDLLEERAVLAGSHAR